jgi:flagellar biosynthesis anti-sigma factor FlgM
MRIGMKTTDPSAISTERTSAYRAPSNTTASRANDFPGDTVSLSSLTTQTLQMPEVRQDKVDNLRQMIANGEYRVDPNQIADAMLSDSANR